MQTFEVVFAGQTLPGADPLQVRQGLQRLFNASDSVLDQFFSGRRIVVKRDLDAAGAEKYRQAFARVGALLDVVATAQSEAAPAAAAAPALLEVAPRDEYMAAFAHVQAPDFGLAEVGADLLVDKPQQQEVEVDISGISLAPVGGDLGQLPSAAPAVEPDISHLSMERID